jgi:LuxR family transcriptional regulator, maltose regulon positive regulatory protein
MDRHWLLQGRLSPPSFRVALLERPALARLRSDGLAHKAVLVSAPAGYGKTALLSQWRTALQAHAVPTAWITLTPADTDPAQLLTYLTMSLISTGVAVGPLENLAEQWFADTPIPAAIANLAGYLAQETRPIVIVVDDVHNAPRAAAEQVLAPLLLPGLPNVHMVLAGRGRPALALAGLRSRGELLEFEAEALRFDAEALATLLPDLTEPQRAILAARTEGWPVALQLARLWLAAKPERVTLIAGFSGHTAEVAEYLTEQVLADLPAPIYATLEMTAPLDALCADVVEAVTGTSEAWAALIALPTLAHLVVPLDEARAWYRLHPLLADYLRDRLRARMPSLETHCHARASAWFESRAMPLEAVHHAAAAGDIKRAAALIEGTGGWELVIFGGAGLMRALLAEIPTVRLKEFPRVELFRALLDAKAGALATARARFDEALAAVAPDGHLPPFLTPIGRDLRIVRHLLARYQDYPIAPNALSEIYAELGQVAPTDGIARATLLNTACLLGLGVGEMRAAQEACGRAVGEMRKLGSLLGINYCTLHLGVASLHLGHRREAEAMFREAADLAEENFGADSGLRALADVHLGVALVARGDYLGAATLFERSLAQVENYDGWLDVYAEAYGAAIAMALAGGSIERAEEYIRRGAATAERRGLTRLERLVKAHQTRLFVRAGRLEDASAGHSWQPGEWRESPFHWREHYVEGVAAAELEIATGHPATALGILADLAAATTAGNRVRDARTVAFLDASARYSAGERDQAAASVVALLEPALQEDDAEFLVGSGELAVPLLQYSRQWTRDRAASSLVRQALGQALNRLATVSGGQAAAGISLLSGREMEVLTELVQGSPNKVIARALQMTENTVKFHLKNVFQKLGVKHRAQAIRVAQERGLIR